jgi:hypothetical protein
MPKRGDWIPKRDDDFYNKQKSYLELVVANKLAWGIPDTAIDPLLDLQTEYVPLYETVQDKKNRTGADVAAHRDCRKRYQTALRAFHKEWVVNNSKISVADKVILVGKVRDTEPTPRGKIELVPYIFLKALGGGVIEVRSQTEKDATRVSMHKLADGIECRWLLVPKGEMPPEGQEDAKKTVVSRKARFTIDCGDKNAGDSFYGFFRWVNTSVPANSGLWTKALRAVIA